MPLECLVFMMVSMLEKNAGDMTATTSYRAAIADN